MRIVPTGIKENAYTEFKSSFGDAAIETLSAFANTKGGCIYVGIDDKGKPLKGLTIGPETLQKWINEIKQKTQPGIIPDVALKKIAGVTVAVLSVNEFPVKPVSFKGRYYRRVGNCNHQLTVVGISNLSLQSLQVSWDSYPANGKTFKDLDTVLIENFIKKVNATGRFQLNANIKNSLEKLKLISGVQITNAAWLLFGKGNIGYNVHLGRFKTPTHIIDDRMLNGALYKTVEEIMQYLVSQIKVAFEIKGLPTQRTEIFEYPLPALREIALNCLIHRDYRSPIDVQIKLFDNHVVFFNPGKLLGDLTLEDLKRDDYHAYARNKLIAEAFYLTGDIEKYGSGFVRIRIEISSYPTMKLMVKEIPNGLDVSLAYTHQKTETRFENVSENVSENLSSQQKILIAIKENQNITYTELSKLVGIAPTNIARNIKKLVEAKKLVRIGPAKGGHWKVL
jgi:ATP-dependent DNA helicase RecG